MGKKYTSTDGEMESVAAIAFHMGQSPLWQSAYKAAADNMGGSVGFYQAATEMARSLEDYAGAKGIDWGGAADWIQTTEDLADKLIDFMIREGRLPSSAERRGLIKGSIVRY